MSLLSAPPAVTIGTALNGLSGHIISTFGEPNTLTYGQTFKAPSVVNSGLNSFSLWIDPIGGPATKFEGYLATWTGTKAGTILWSSPEVTTIPGSNGLTRVDYSNILVDLDPNERYVFFVTIVNAMDGIDDSAVMAIESGNTYSDGDFVFLNHSTFANLTAFTWSLIPLDTEFLAEFVAVNHVPVWQSGGTGLVVENSPLTTVVYDANAVDSDAGQVLTYSIGGDDANMFEIDGASGQVRLKANADFESRSIYHLVVTATDNGWDPQTSTKDITISVFDVDWDVNLFPNTIAENLVVGSGVKVGSLSIFEDDTSGKATVMYLGGPDASAFEIRDGKDLYYVGASPDFENRATYHLSVKSTDGSRIFSKDLSVGVLNLNDNNTTGDVAISGSASQGETLSASNSLQDLDGLGAITYQWFADGILLAGKTDPQLKLGQELVGRNLSVVAHSQDGSGALVSVSSASTAAVANVNDAPTGNLSIAGILRQGEVLVAQQSLSDPDGMGAIAYQWMADGATVVGVVGDSLRLTQDQVGKTITVKATYVDGYGTTEAMTAATTALVSNVNDAPTGSVSISGALIEGQSLYASQDIADLDGLGALRYQWLADGHEILGANSRTLLVGSAQVGKALSVQVSYIDGFGRLEQVASATTGAVAAIPAIIGTSGPDVLVGTRSGDRMSGLAGNDRLDGGDGDDQIDGGAGIDTVFYATARAGAVVASTFAGHVVHTAQGGSDYLTNVERLSFSDMGLALDLNGNAGTVAKILGAVFGADAVSNRVYFGIGLHRIDAGMSTESLLTLALGARLGTGASDPKQVVDLLFGNLTGHLPSVAEEAAYVKLIEGKETTLAGLGVFAAESDLNKDNINLVGLSDHGVEYLPFGGS